MYVYVILNRSGDWKDVGCSVHDVGFTTLEAAKSGVIELAQLDHWECEFGEEYDALPEVERARLSLPDFAEQKIADDAGKFVAELIKDGTGVMEYLNGEFTEAFLSEHKAEIEKDPVAFAKEAAAQVDDRRQDDGEWKGDVYDLSNGSDSVEEYTIVRVEICQGNLDMPQR